MGTARAQLHYVEASTLGILHKCCSTEQPYHRVDTSRYPTLTSAQKELLSQGAGLAVGFTTDSRTIGVRWQCRPRKPLHNASDIAQSGLDLYVRDSGRWVYAGSAVPSAVETLSESVLVRRTGTEPLECLLYLPLFREVVSLQIGVDRGSRLSAADGWSGNRIVVYGSSITHGIAASRPGMAYVARLSRAMGLDLCNLGLSGNGTMTPTHARILAETRADAFLLDCFSNPSAEVIRHRLRPFVDTLRRAHPTAPLIFLQTLYRTHRPFNPSLDAAESAKRRAAREAFAELLALGYRNIWLLDPGLDTGVDREGTIDGTHPNDLGIERIVDRLLPQLTAILSRCGIGTAAVNSPTGDCPGGKLRRWPATDPSVRYVGRVARSGDGSVSFDWTGSYLTLCFTGTSLRMRVSDTGRNYYNLRIDNDSSRVLSTFGRDSSILLASGLGPGVHRLWLQKRTEGREGRTTIHEFATEAGNSLLPDTLRRSRHIEFIGDSYTCGYGVEGRNRHEHFRAETQNSDRTYASLTARYFDADYTLVAHSGRGVVRNYGEKRRLSPVAGTMTGRMMRLYDEVDSLLWDFTRSPWHPDAVVINLGTNDFSRGPHPTDRQFRRGYERLLAQIRQVYGPQVPILCMAPGTKGDEADRCIRTLCRETKDPRLYLVPLDRRLCDPERDLGSDDHPNRSGQRKIALQLIPYVATSTGWPMPPNAIE